MDRAELPGGGSDAPVTGRASGAALAPIGNSPVVVLVRPQLADNIGAVARAMANGGLFHLRLVAPRDGWPQEKAWRNASGADRILDALTLHDTVADAVADLHHVLATCPRPRHVIKPILTARGAAAELRAICARDLRVGVLFGPERAGLDREDLACADALVRFPLNPAFMSLNLAQAVMVLAYEWWVFGDETTPRTLMTNETRIATKAELENFLGHLVAELDASGFLDNLPKRPGMEIICATCFSAAKPPSRNCARCTASSPNFRAAAGNVAAIPPDDQTRRSASSASTTAGSASVDVSPSPSVSPAAIFRSMRRMILPLRVFGKLGAQWISSGAAIGPSRAAPRRQVPCAVRRRLGSPAFSVT